MRQAKSIDELYVEVKDYDLVLCNDAPLALALNNRLDKPLVGTFAVTPRQLAGDLSYEIVGKRLWSDIEIVKEIAKRTGYSIRYVHSEIENIKAIRRYTGDVGKHLVGKRAKRIYDEYREIPTLDKVMGMFDGTADGFFKGKKIAVIGSELYDDLDKHFNPEPGTYEEISLFKRGGYEIGEIRELSNDRQIAENAVSLIEKKNAKDFAVVMDVGGNIADAVRSALYRKRIPFINSLAIRDLNNIREFLEFLTLSLTFDTVKVGQIRELISAYKGSIEPRYDKYIACEYAKFCRNERTVKLLGLMGSITEHTFADVCDIVAERNAASQIKLLLNEMELADAKVNKDDVGDLIYAVDNIGDLKHNEQIPDYEKEGVLLVDCKNSVYVDRPNVIFIGMGQEWEKDLSELNFIDYRLKDDEAERNMTKFEVLLQQGTNRFYLCNSIKNGEKPKPCTYFDMISGNVNDTFADVCGNVVSGAWYEPEDGGQTPTSASEFAETEYRPKAFSKSSYNSFATCPRKFMFSRIIGGQDSESTVLGNYIHSYAELRICFPEIAKEEGIDHYVDIIADRCAGLDAPEAREITKTAIRNALVNLDRLIENDGIANAEKKIVQRNGKYQENELFPEKLKDKKCDISEIDYSSHSDHMHGIFDAIIGSHIYDFKTGKIKSGSEIMKEMDRDKKHEYGLEFQPMFYLSLIDEAVPDGKKVFTLFYSKDNYNRSMKGEQFSIDDNKRDVSLISSKEWYLENCYFDNHAAKSYKFLWNNEETIISEIEKVGIDNIDESFTDHLDGIIGPLAKTNLGHLRSFVKKLIDNLVGTEMISAGSNIYITRKGLEDFRKQVALDYDKVKEYYRAQFPITEGVHCSNCEFNKACIRKEVDIDD